MKKIALFMCLCSGLFWACSDFKVTTTDDGDRIQYLVDEDGETAKEGDMVTFDLLLRDQNDTTYRDTFKDGEPLQLNAMKGMGKGTFENAIFHLSKGDSAIVFVNVDSIFSKMQQPLPPGITAGSDLRFIVKVRDVMNPEQFTASLEKKREAEVANIKEYVAKNLAGADTLEQGVYYKVLNPGSGSMPERGNTVVVNYEGRLFDGNIFDQTRPGDSPFEFAVGTGAVIRGWDIVLMKMKKGEKATVVIPSAVAYGDRGAGGRIAPFTPLVFDIELVDIKK
ncbi:FKBP-type peptidyl-prolyl cis-trans isomerase [Spirosomataceae bacterium TFI 002]|nr:FKBP-type peptidyl-prolyl cis-trans isomerase [Spirosomataceae bacterium TFI 002]